LSAVKDQGKNRSADDREKHRNRKPGDAAAGAEREKETALQVVWMLVSIDELIIAQIALRAVK
jgi:hypothetical protein